MSCLALKNKKILLFSQYFFGYEFKIKSKLEMFGANVDLYDEMSVKSAKNRALLKISPKLFQIQTEKYYYNILKKIQNNSYDYVLFIDCEMPTPKVLNTYKNVFKNARFCLHMWDSIKNLHGVQKKFKYFDYITTFDREDSEKYNLNFRPLFFADEYRTNNTDQNYTYDIAFVGTIHSDRYKILKNILAQAKNNLLSIYVYPYLQSKFIYYFYKILKREFYNTSSTDFVYEKKTSVDISNIINKSKAVIDIQHPKQSGLTMRTLEMVGMKKKLITTNADIINYDFYNKDNIVVLDRNNPKFDVDFLKTPYVELEKKVYEYYSLDTWCLDVLGIKNDK